RAAVRHCETDPQRARGDCGGRLQRQIRRYAVLAAGPYRHAAQRTRCAHAPDMTPAQAIDDLRRRLTDGLAQIDPHHRLLGRPVSYRVIDGHMLEITY